MNKKDEEFLKKTKESLNLYDKKFQWKEYNKKTNSLYRFGLFNINNNNYIVSGISFFKNIVTFELENNEKIKIKYDIINNKPINQGFIIDSKYKTFIKQLKLFISDYLKDLSDKLRD